MIKVGKMKNNNSPRVNSIGFEFCFVYHFSTPPFVDLNSGIIILK